MNTLLTPIKLLLEVVGLAFGWIFIFLTLKSCRTQLKIHPNCKEHISSKAIFLCWHEHLFSIPVLLKKQKRLALLASKGKHGNFTSLLFLALGGRKVIRGSSYKKPLSSLREMHRALQSGHSLCITADGSRGPAHKLQPGALQLSAKNKVPILSVALHAERKWRLPSWDRTQLPKPFSRIVVYVHSPFVQSFEAPHLSREELQKNLAENLFQAGQESQKLFEKALS